MLRYDLPDAFEEVMITLRYRAQAMLEMADMASIPSSMDSGDKVDDEEESAI